MTDHCTIALDGAERRITGGSMKTDQKTLHALLTPSRMDQLRMRCGLRAEDATDADYLTPDPERLTCPGCKTAVAASRAAKEARR